MVFMNDISAALTESRGRPHGENTHDAIVAIQKLESIFPKAYLDRENRTTQRTSDVELYRRLLFSATNGFAGMDVVHYGAVLRCLSQNTNISSLLSRSFQDSPIHATKSLAENLFRAAIEAGDHQAIRLLLQTNLVDIDKMACILMAKSIRLLSEPLC